MMRKTLSYLYLLLFVALSINAAELEPLVLPNDEGEHNFAIEWWYYTGHFETIDTNPPRQFAYEMVVFRGAVVKPFPAYVAHFALIDLNEKKHHPYQQVSIIASQRPPAPTKSGFEFVFERGKWVIEGNNGHDRLLAITPKHGIDLLLHAEKLPAFFGDQGIVDYGSAGKMAYYSRTRMNTTGTVTLPDANGHNRKYRVKGSSWMDHQWGSAGNPNLMGWDWFSVQLENNIDLMMFQVRNQKSKEIVKTAVFVIGEESEISSIPEELINIEAKESFDFGNVVYSTAWNISAPAPYDMDLFIKARFPEQRFKMIGQVTPIYWEGSCSTEGTFLGEKVKGQGFSEMAGYE